MDDQTSLSRREFLKASGLLTGVLAAHSVALLALAPTPVWALPLQTLSAADGKILLALTRHIFPHAKLDDAVYALVVQDLDRAATADAAVKTLLRVGIDELNTAAAGDWLSQPPQKQLEVVHTIAGKPLFDKVRSTAVVSLYNNELAFAHFGYQGNAFKHGGGYLRRGFNDLTWLPAPPATASPDPA